MQTETIDKSQQATPSIDEELIDTLIAISVVAKRLAANLTQSKTSSLLPKKHLKKQNPSQPRKLQRLLNRLKQRKHRNLPIPRKMFVQYSLPNQPLDIRRKSKSFLRNMALSS